ncbi:FAD-dependent monooxygenase [Streptomyces sp. NBC_00726]|uniref:FAD-dependent monooxygenase n=1 Tax=Streptomyces sp. NBC_00726 TaxID=2903674 RepID=UPI00386F9F17
MGNRESEGRLPVLVAGAGPVGLMAACELASAGVAVTVLEERTEPDRVLKAGSVGPLAIEALERLGLHDELVTAEQATMAGYAQMAEELTAAGRPEEASALDKAQREHFAGLEKIDASRRSDPGRRRMRVPQPVLVQILLRKAGQLGVRVLSGHAVEGLTQDAEGVTVDVRTGEGAVRFEAAYLLGCDGRDSAVRSAAGFAFPGTAPTMLGRQGVVSLADPTQIPPGIHAVEGGVVVWGLGVDRVAALEFIEPPAGLGPLTLDELHAAVRRVSGIDLDIIEMKAGGRFTDEARHVPEYRKGRVLLAGDAAHIHAPVGGQGLNYGLIDAVNVAWKLAARLHGWAGDELLDTYSAERHPQAEQLLDNTRAQTALMRPDSHSRALRTLFERLLELDDAHRFIGDMMAALDTRYELGDEDPLVGTLCPDVKLAVPDDSADVAVRRLAELPHDGQGVLLTFDAGPLPVRVADGWTGRVRVVPAVAERDEVRAMLLRPDGCVAWVLRPGADPTDDSLAAALCRWFGQPAH